MSPAATPDPPLGGIHPSGAVRSMVGIDPWHWVRIVAVAIFVTTYLRWCRDHGIIVDPFSVLISVALILAVAHIGQPLHRWRQLVVDISVYAVVWLGYNDTYGLANRLGRPRQVESVRNIDRVLFLGTDPNVWMQKHFYDPLHVRWYDVVASLVYLSHFVLPAAVMVALWITNRRQWVRFMRRFATVLAIACISFVIIPTVPPWLAGEGGYHVLPQLARPVGRGWTHIGLSVFTHAWDVDKDDANPLAAMPSLHAALSMFTVAFFLPWVRRRWLKVAIFAFPLTMALSLVYLAEHYVSDVLGGWLVVGVSFLAWNRIERRLRARRTEGYRLEHQDEALGPVVVTGAGRTRRLFVDGTVFAAESDPLNPNHAAARALLNQSVQDFERGEVTIFSHQGHAEGASRRARAVLRFCEVVRIRSDLTRRAKRVLRSHPERNLAFDQAVTLVVLRRERITEIASFDPLFSQVDACQPQTGSVDLVRSRQVVG